MVLDCFLCEILLNADNFSVLSCRKLQLLIFVIFHLWKNMGGAWVEWVGIQGVKHVFSDDSMCFLLVHWLG